MSWIWQKLPFTKKIICFRDKLNPVQQQTATFIYIAIAMDMPTNP